jgi:uncharacterized protein YqhQ
LTWSAAIAADELDEHGEARPLGWTGVLMLVVVLAVALTIFFAGPVLATAWLDSRLDGWLVVLIEGLIRLALLIGYIALIGRMEDIRRVFEYHGAEHMTIHAFENGLQLRVQGIRRFAKEHPRCGTSFLLTVAVIAVFVFVLIPSDPLWWRFASRLLLIPVIAGISYEAIRFAGFHLGAWPVRLLFSGNIALQKLTTRQPDDEQIQVAIASLEAVIAEEQAATAPPEARAS